ncbi:uncharacterized protein LOC113331331 [Papaver somniferum]|uniref:uncharacterized protein LOC113331331 n=1 Tax=Papaver somniferum TaxID=3469 RepID=UPI000E704248|nr:uncharacterized protein LOC113331331 [Papaver somniferum]
MGFFGIYKEACKLTAANKTIFSQITLTLLLPSAFFLLSEIRFSTYSKIETPWIDNGWSIGQYLYYIFLFVYIILSTSSIVYTVACFYTSRDITYKKATSATGKLWWDLIVTFLWCFLFLAIYTSVTFGLLWFWFSTDRDGIRTLILIICLSVPAFAGLTYILVVCNIATVVTILEKDLYGRKALAKSTRLIKGKIWVSCAVFMLLGITFGGIVFTYCYLSLYGRKEISMVGRVFVAIGCHFLMAIWFHILFVVDTVVYFVCKSVHNEEISTVATHLEVPVIHLVVQIKDVHIQLEQVPA